MGRRYGTSLWDVVMGRCCGTSLWDVVVGRRYGTLLWDVVMGRRYGTSLWDAVVGRRCGTLLWDVVMGRCCGTSLWDVVVDHSPVSTYWNNLLVVHAEYSVLCDQQCHSEGHQYYYCSFVICVYHIVLIRTTVVYITYISMLNRISYIVTIIRYNYYALIAHCILTRKIILLIISYNK